MLSLRPTTATLATVGRTSYRGSKNPSEKQQAKLIEIVGEALKLLSATIPATIRVEARIGDNTEIMVDESQIHQVVTNLVSNAAAADIVPSLN